VRDDQSAHIDELVRVAVGEQSTRDAIIHESWRRCVSEHKLDPVVLRDPVSPSYQETALAVAPLSLKEKSSGGNACGR
jgi:transcriptional regulator of acetoin/glycerol metabolism